MSTITATIPVTIDAQATTFCGPTEDRTWWSASISVFGRRIASVGTNGEGQHATKRAAIQAAIREARDNGYKLTVSRKVAATA